jgi:hypothetical protein
MVFRHEAHSRAGTWKSANVSGIAFKPPDGAHDSEAVRHDLVEAAISRRRTAATGLTVELAVC